MSTPSDPQPGAAPDLDPPVADQPVDGGNAQPAPSLYHHDAATTTVIQRPPPHRPAEVWAGAVFLTLAALPVVILGGVLAALPGQTGVNLRQKITDAGTSAGMETLVMLFRVTGVVLLVLGVGFAVLAWLAVRPKKSARTAATVLVVIEVALLVSTMIIAAPDPVSIGVLLLAVAGTVLFYLPRSDEFISYHR